jgi:tripartite-type tricarboxylate transporter receptor subunit TctC
LTGWFVIMAPTGTPAEVITRVNVEMDKILKAPDLVKRLADLGFYTDGADTPEGTRAFIKAQHELWGRVVEEIGLEPE